MTHLPHLPKLAKGGLIRGPIPVLIDPDEPILRLEAAPPLHAATPTAGRMLHIAAEVSGQHPCTPPGQHPPLVLDPTKPGIYTRAKVSPGSIWRCGQCGRLWRVDITRYWAPANLYTRFRYRKEGRRP